MRTDTELHRRVREMLTWQSAHVGLDRALADVPTSDRGRKPEGLPYSLWQLLEHIRLAQRDILMYCSGDEFTRLDWPDDYWPEQAAPPTPEAWQQSIDSVRQDRDRLAALVDEVDLYAKVPHSDEHSYLRELLLVADHTAYHVGQIVLVRRLLGCW